MLHKRLVALIAAGVLVSCLAMAGCGGNQAASSSTESAPAASASSAASSAAAPSSSAAVSESTAASAAAEASGDSFIGEEAAIEIALKDAGFAAGDVAELEAELDADDAVPHYEVEFKQGGSEYSYSINAATGEIISSNSEVDD